jgi:hypothetical protein
MTRGVLFDAQAAGMPVTIIYDRQGREVARLAGGADWDSPESVALLEAVLAESNVAPILETERLRLRGHELRDFDASAAMWADETSRASSAASRRHARKVGAARSATPVIGRCSATVFG